MVHGMGLWRLEIVDHVQTGELALTKLESALLRTRSLHRREATGTSAKSDSPDAAFRHADVWVEAPIGRGKRWIVAFRISQRGVAPVVSELRIFPNEEGRSDIEPGPVPKWKHAGEWSHQLASVPPSGVSRRLLREVHLREWRTAMRRGFDSLDSHTPGAFRFEDDAARPPGKYQRREDAWYAQAASTYVELRASAHDAPLVELSRRLGITRTNAADAIRRARQLRLLTKAPAGRGTAGGRITKRAQRILAAQEKGRSGR